MHLSFFQLLDENSQLIKVSKPVIFFIQYMVHVYVRTYVHQDKTSSRILTHTQALVENMTNKGKSMECIQ